MTKSNQLKKKRVIKKTRPIKHILQTAIVATRSSPRAKSHVNYDESKNESPSVASQKKKNEDEDVESAAKGSRPRTRSSSKSSPNKGYESEEVATKPTATTPQTRASTKTPEKKGNQAKNIAKKPPTAAKIPTTRRLYSKKLLKKIGKTADNEQTATKIPSTRTSTRSRATVNYDESREGFASRASNKDDMAIEKEFASSKTDNYTKLKLNKIWCIQNYEVSEPRRQLTDIGVYYNMYDAFTPIEKKDKKNKQVKAILDQINHARFLRKKMLYPCRYDVYFPFYQYKVGTVPFYLLYCIICSVKMERKISNMKTKMKNLKSSMANIYFVPENESDNSNFLLSGNATLKFKLREFMSFIKSELDLDDSFIYIPGLIVTLEEHAQEIHSDFYRLPDSEDNYPWVLHMPLCEEGMWLNILSVVETDDNKVNLTPVRVHIPLFQFLIVRGDVLHGGVFGSKGNVRLHIVIKPAGHDAQQYFPDREPNKEKKQGPLPSFENYANNIVHITANDREYKKNFFSHNNNCCFDDSVFKNLK